MYGQNIIGPSQYSIMNNTQGRDQLRNRILINLVLEPQTHFDQNNYINFISNLRLDNFPSNNGTVFTNTFGDLSVSDTPDLITNQEIASVLKKDRIFDVYIESMETFGAVFNNNKNNMAFKLTFDNFNMNTNSNLLSDVEVFIPNVNVSSLTPKTTIYRHKTLYYVASTTPDRLTSLTGKISTLDNATIFRNPTDTSNTDRLIIDLVLIPRYSKIV